VAEEHRRRWQREAAEEQRSSRRVRVPSKKSQDNFDSLKDKARDETKKVAAQALRDKARQEIIKAEREANALAKRNRRGDDAEYATTEREANALAKRNRRADDAEYATTEREANALAKRNRRADDAEYATTEREANALAKRNRRADDAEYATTEREANALAKRNRRADDAEYATTEREANTLAKRHRRTAKETKMKFVKTKVIDKVEELTGSAARRGFRSFIFITPIHEDVKDRIEKEIDMFQEGKEKKLGVCACCDELCKEPLKVDAADEAWVE
jgi:hypothetical protein